MAQHILQYGAKTKAEVASSLEEDQAELKSRYRGVLPEGMDQDVQGHFMASPAAFLTDLEALADEQASVLELDCEKRNADFREQAVVRKEQLRETVRSAEMEGRNQKHLLEVAQKEAMAAPPRRCLGSSTTSSARHCRVSSPAWGSPRPRSTRCGTCTSLGRSTGPRRRSPLLRSRGAGGGARVPTWENQRALRW